LEGDNLATVYASSDIFTFPSKSETFGQVVLEAQASGIPVIAFRAEGVGDIIQDGRTGWLVPVASPATIMANRSNRTDRTSMSPHIASEFEEMINFEKVIYAAIEMEERRICAGLEAIRWARTWTWSEATEKAVDTFREVIC
jgi:glycosyltransferase involved in cell wall biosynthesis